MINHTSTVTIPADEVTPATEPLPESAAREPVDHLVLQAHEALNLVAGQSALSASFREDLNPRLSSAPIPGSILACSHDETALVTGVTYHPAMAALRFAYAQHRPIALSPDMIWILICQGVAQHINLNAEHLRPEWVSHSGQATIEVPEEAPRFGGVDSMDADWPAIVDRFAANVTDFSSERAKAFRADFSTSTQVEKTACDIVLLGALERYYHFLLTRMICGIPYIELEGTESDWKAIVDRVEAFAGIGLDWWLKPLKAILNRFSAAFSGEPSPEFWRSIYRIYRPDRPCSSESATGWFSMFFPYIADKNKQIRTMNPWLSGEKDLDALVNAPDPKSAHRSYHGVFDGDLPTGMAKAEFDVKLNDRYGNCLLEEKMDFLGGFVGVSQNPQSLCLRPEIGWAVRRSKRPAVS
jgi:hypothetical protein